MIQPVFNTIMAFLLARFALNDLPHAAGLLGGASNPVTVVYETPQDRERVASAPGLVSFIVAYLDELRAKYGTAPRHLHFAEQDVIASQVWSLIYVHPGTADMWLKDEESTKQVLRFIIAHELRHFLTKVGRIRIPLPKGPKWREARKEYEEKAADEFAEQETGISTSRLDELLRSMGYDAERARV